MANKIKFGLSDVHYAPITAYDEETKTYTYGDIKSLPGAVSLSLDVEGSSDSFYADNIVYYTTLTNSGYSGDLEIARITEEFRTTILGETKNSDGVVIENADAQGTEFALMFQIEGNENPNRYILWRCSAERPSIEGETKEDTTTPKTDTLSITVMARENDHMIRGLVEKATETAATYESWFTTVYQPADESGE